VKKTEGPKIAPLKQSKDYTWQRTEH